MRAAFTLFGLTLLILSGCTASGTNYTQTAQNLRGANVNQLLKRWGTPDIKVSNPQGNTFYIYNSTTYRDFPSPTPQVGVHFTGKGVPVILTPTTSNAWYRHGQSLSCAAWFEVNNKGIIVSSKTQGGGCGAIYPR
jgi:hypothetical protein